MSRSLQHDYIGLSSSSELPSMENFAKNGNFNISSSNFTSKNGGLKTELSLGLPGCESPERKVTIFGKDFEGKSQNGCSLKRGFSDAIDGSEKWVFSIIGKCDSNLSKDCGSKNFNNNGVVENTNNGQKLVLSKEVNVVPPPKNIFQDKQPQLSSAAGEHASAPAAKAQVVGWPPIRSFRKNTLASTSAKNDNGKTEEKSTAACLYVKVSMDGAPYLRKVDLQTYKNYMELSSALEKMFSCFITGQYISNGHGKQDGLGESQSTDLQNAEYVLTYEDKDGDWMLVGDVPWRMFTENCRKLRIMKGSEAIGLAPNAAEKCKTEA